MWIDHARAQGSRSHMGHVAVEEHIWTEKQGQVIVALVQQ